MLAPRPKTAFYDPSLEVKFKVVLYPTLVFLKIWSHTIFGHIYTIFGHIYTIFGHTYYIFQLN